MDINKNSFIFLFTTIMVFIIAILLSIVNIKLKPLQDTNVDLEKKQNILNSIGVSVDRNLSEDVYSKYITQELVINTTGDEIEGSAFDIDLALELKKDPKKQLLPLFISEVDGSKRYIIPLRGKGLWGPIWGFLSLKDDLDLVYGAVFDHKSETPGLGAEINTIDFQEQFKGKRIFKDNRLKSIAVIKGGVIEGDLYSVDGISGGTITSNGVSDMLYERLQRYLPFLDKQRKIFEVESVLAFMDTISNSQDTLKKMKEYE